MSGSTTDRLRQVTERVIDDLTSVGMPFTALDVSNAVKRTISDARHREISPLVRALFERQGMGRYIQTSIEVMAGGQKPATAFLYHLPEHPTSVYDDAMRAQLAVPPAQVARPEDSVSTSSQEIRVRIGKDGRGRLSRTLLSNAGITSEQVDVTVDTSVPRLVIKAGSGTGYAALAPLPFSVPFGGAGDMAAASQSLHYEHPTLLHLPKTMIEVFGPNPTLTAKVEGGSVIVLRA